jgi:SAM-dependent methyltransferase
VNSNVEWFQKWFDENYLLLYCHRDSSDAEEQVRLVLNTLNPGKGWKILDLGCGNGRHSRIFHRKGFSISGLDLSKKLLEDGLAQEPELNLFQGDMRNIPGEYDLILSLFTSFGYFTSDRDNEKVIASVSASLKQEGWFWMDFLNPDYLETHLVPQTKTELSGGVVVVETRSIENGFVKKEIHFSTPEGQREYCEQVKLYSPEQLEWFFRKNSIKPVGRFGTYTGDPWELTSPRTIIYGQLQS